MRRVQHSVQVPAPAYAVWERAVTAEGINDEMRPVMTMTMPRALRGRTIDEIPLGQPVGRAWLRLLGVLPFDYDRLVLVELEPGRRFLERSTMLSMRLWQHERTLTPLPGGTLVEDTVTFDPRLPLRPVAGLLHLVVDRFFRHRHRRLLRHWSEAGPSA